MTRGRLANALRWGGLASLVLGALLQAEAPFDPFPIWTTDPWLAFTPASGLGPTLSIAINAVMVIAAGLCLLGERLSGRRLYPWLIHAAWLGSIPALYHGLLREGVSVDDVRLGSAWMAGIAAGVAAAHLARQREIRIFALAVALSLLPAVVVRAGAEVFHEHPLTVESYESNRETFLSARGWAADGPQARAFERRLRQPNPAAWFAMTNVAAAVFGLGVILGLGVVLTWLRTRAGPPWAVVVSGALAVASGGALWLTSSKAAMGLTLLGVIGLVVAHPAARLGERIIRNRRTLAVIVGLASIVAVGAGVLARGVIGPSWDERSILFRSYYAQAAASITLDHPLLGVGPDRFQSAFQRAKPPMCPEDVASAHSAPLDFIATLGLGGWLWAGLFGAGVIGLTWTVLRPTPSDARDPSDEPLVRLGSPSQRLLALAAGAPVLLAAYAEVAIVTPEGVLARVVAAVLAAVFAVAVASVMARSVATFDRVLAAGAIGLWMVMLHGLLDVTLVWPNAAPWMGLAIGLVVVLPKTPELVRAPAWRGGLLAAPFALAGIALLSVSLLSIAPWERRLRDAGDPFQPLAEARLLMGLPIQDVDWVAPRLSRVLGRPVPPHPDSIQRALEEAMGRAGDESVARLGEAFELMPAHLPTARALARAGAAFEPPGFEPAAEAAERVVEARPEAANAWSWLARAEHIAHPAAPTARALEAHTRAAELAPSHWGYARDAALAFLEADDLESASDWARRALARSAWSSLDSLTGPTPGERSMLQEIIETP